MNSTLFSESEGVNIPSFVSIRPRVSELHIECHKILVLEAVTQSCVTDTIVFDSLNCLKAAQ